ncbi:MAG: hypothetical protein QF915_00655, partial [Candidatus Woesearchaeota archaeon]|nr:hypothetical protein [Candidatus Woesearchaeota archaeon]
ENHSYEEQPRLLRPPRRLRFKNLFIAAALFAGLFLFYQKIPQKFIDAMLNGDRQAQTSDYQTLETSLKAIEPYEAQFEEFRKNRKPIVEKALKSPTPQLKTLILAMHMKSSGIIVGSNFVHINYGDVDVFYLDADSNTDVDFYQIVEDGKSKMHIIGNRYWKRNIEWSLPFVRPNVKYFTEPDQQKVDNDYAKLRKMGIRLKAKVETMINEAAE